MSNSLLSAEALAKIEVDPLVWPWTGLKAEEIAKQQVSPQNCRRRLFPFSSSWARFYTEEDATLVEVNPLVLTPEGTILALDGKVSSTTTQNSPARAREARGQVR